ncbi:hypothetical protein BBJ28_00021453 [Nothophytophthora sp. Chile5]|nr:hypothetical protein BBJ28_00021453 [Nothophytophthora sp. Chile5]
MQVTVTSADGGKVVQVSAEPQQQINSVSLRLQEQVCGRLLSVASAFGISPASQVLLLDGNPIRLNQTVAAMRINGNASPEVLLEIMDKNPQLLAEVGYNPENFCYPSEHATDPTIAGVPVPAVPASPAPALAAPASPAPPAAGGESDAQKIARLVALGFPEQQVWTQAACFDGCRTEATMADEFREDLYEILGLEPASDEKQVARAYKKKSILHHPDRGGDVKKFLELTHARDVLLDPKKKEAYDKKLSRELLAKKKQREREAELDGKRRQMRDGTSVFSLVCHRSFDRSRKTSAQQQKSDLSKLREKGLARQQELQDRLAREARRRSELMKAKDAHTASKSRRTVTFKWDRRQFSHSDDTLSRDLRGYGEIEAIKMKSASAKVVFAEAMAAANAVRTEGHKSCWREVSIQGHIVETEELPPVGAEGKAAASTRGVPTLPDGPISLQDHLAFEKKVLANLHEKAKLQQAKQSAVRSH